MLRLELDAQPRWVELLPGVRLLLRPLGTALMMAARADVAGCEAEAGPEAAAVALAKAVARRAVVDWEGVGDADGAPLPVTPAGVDALLELLPAYEAFSRLYLARGLLLDAEKNGSAPSLSGTSAGAGSSAQAADGSVPTVPRG